jgi:hypothetical protein
MLYDLLRRDLSRFDHRRIPHTPGLDDQKLRSLDSQHRWLMTVLDRGFVWESHHGVQSFDEWHDFVTTELFDNSYQQFCRKIGWHQRQARTDLGKLLSACFRWGRPKTAYPVSERPMIPPWRGGQSTTFPSRDEPELPIGDMPESADGDGEPPSRSPPTDEQQRQAWLEQIAVVRKRQMPGYHVGSLEEGRARFTEYLGDLPMPWREPP